ncbi:MAG: alpha/beta hydrolase [Xanthobacteraceae bacterium]
MYEPGVWLPRVSPTPILLIVALGDTIAVADLALAAYERALEPKRLVTIPGGHFDAYLGHFARSSSAATEWFSEHLG